MKIHEEVSEVLFKEIIEKAMAQCAHTQALQAVRVATSFKNDCPYYKYK